MQQQKDFFVSIAHIITPGSHVTWRGEDGAIFGWFFNSKLIEFDSYQELKKLQEPFEMKASLEKELGTKDEPIKAKKPKM